MLQTTLFAHPKKSVQMLQTIVLRVPKKGISGFIGCPKKSKNLISGTFGSLKKERILWNEILKQEGSYLVIRQL